MNKKAQITAFMILGIILLALAGIAAYMMLQPTAEISEASKLSEKAQVVTKYVDSCIDTTVNPGIVRMGMQGGYTQYPLVSLSTIYSDVPYYYYKGINSTITKEEIEKQFAKYINEKLPICLGGFSTLNESQYAIKAGEPKATVTLDQITGMAVNINYPIEITTDNRVENISKFNKKYKVRMGTLLDVSNKIVSRVAEDPRVIPMTYLAELGAQNKIQIDTFVYEGNTVLYLIQDNQSMAGNVPLLFMFATRMEQGVHIPSIESANLTAVKGQKFTYKANATDPDGDVLGYADDSTLFDIDSATGEIEFTPNTTGTYQFNISAFDGTNQASSQFNIRIS